MSCPVDPCRPFDFFNLPFVWGVFEVRHREQIGIAISWVIQFEKLDWEDIVKSSILLRQGESVGLSSDPFEDSEWSNPSRTELSISVTAPILGLV